MFCQQSLLLLLWPVCKLYWERFHRTTYICMSKHQDGTCSGYCGNNIGISNYLPNLVIRFSSSGLHPALLGQEPLLRMPGVSLSGCFFIVCCLSLGCDSPYCSSLLVFPLIFILLYVSLYFLAFLWKNSWVSLLVHVKPWCRHSVTHSPEFSFPFETCVLNAVFLKHSALIEHISK